MNQKKRGLQYGVIGAGSMGRHHVRIANSLPGVKLVGIAEPHEDSARNIPDILKPLLVSDYRQLLEKVDAVCIATPTSTHYEVGKVCLEAGKHVLMEKPLAANSLQAKELVDLAEKKGLVLAAGFIERVNPAYAALIRLIKGQKIIGINIKRFSPFPARISDTNVIHDMMVHDLDLLLSLLPQRSIESLKAEGKIIKSKMLDQVAATLFFDTGIIAKVEADRAFDGKVRLLSVTTENSIYEADLLNKKLVIRDLATHVPSAQPVKQADQLTVEIKAFVKAVRTGTRPAVDGLAGYHAQKLAEEIEKACSSH